MVPGTKEAGLVETTVHSLVREATVLRAGIDTIEIDTKEEKYSKKKIEKNYFKGNYLMKDLYGEYIKNTTQ